MEVEFAMLADSAQASEGKVYILGGGIDKIFAKAFPTTHPQMALALKLKLDSSECEREHALEIELWDADGNPAGPKLSAKFEAPREDLGRPSYVQLVLNIVGQTFKAAGDYAFKVLVDGQHLKTLPLYLVERPDGQSND